MDGAVNTARAGLFPAGWDDRPLLFSAGRWWTGRSAMSLAGLPPRPGQRSAIAIMAESGPATAGLVLGCLLRGDMVCPLHLGWSAEEAAEALERIRAERFVVSAGVAGRLGDLAEGPGVYMIGEEGIQGNGALPGGAPPPDGVAAVLFSSGTTGTPKAVCLTADNLACGARNGIHLQRLAAGSVTLCTLPLSDYYGLIQLLMQVITGSRLVIDTRPVLFEKQRLRQATQAGVSVLATVPYVLQEMLHRGGDAVRPFLDGLGRVALSSDVAPKNLIDLLESSAGRRLVVTNVYGLTEAGRAMGHDMAPDDDPQTIGRPAPGVEVRLFGDGAEEGILGIRGGNVFVGYLGSDGRTVPAELRDGFFLTRDIVRRSERGDYILVGRDDDVINVRGSKFHPQPVETWIRSHPDILDARIVYRDGTLAVEVVLDHPDSTDVPELTAVLRRGMAMQFPASVIPEVIRPVTGIRREGVNRKIDRSGS